MRTGMAKLDLKRTEHAFYTAPRTRAIVVDIPEESFLMLDGEGSAREGAAFHDAIGAIHAVAHALRERARRQDPARDHVVMPLEALWWWEGETRFHEAPEKEWRWTLLIREPDFVSREDALAAIAAASAKVPLAARVRFERFREGRAMQILHVGPYKDEWPTLRRLHEDIHRAGYVHNGKHHEIYLGDPRRARPENIRTILRQPVRWTDEGNE